MADLPASRTAAQRAQALQQGQCLCGIRTTGSADETEQKPSQTPPFTMSSKFKNFLKRSRAWLCQISKVSKTQIKDPGCKNDTPRKCPRGDARRAVLPDLSFAGCAFPPFSCLQRHVPVALSREQELCRPPAPARLPAAPPGPAAQGSPSPPRPRTLAAFLPRILLRSGCSRGRSPASGPSWTVAHV